MAAGPELHGEAAEAVRVRRLMRAESDARVSPLELFFDLVFVFALTQVTAFMAADPTFASMGRAMIVLAIIWWAWSGYAWLTSTVDPEQVLTRVVMFAAMAAMLLVALATPHAFADDTVLWGVAYALVRLLHAALFALAARDVGDRQLAHQVTSLVLSIIPGAGLIILSGLAFDGTARDVLWLAAVVLDYGIVLAYGVEGWHVQAGHFAERFGLVIIIALGESIVAIGVGVEGTELGAGEIVAAVAGMAVVAMLWWAYFDLYALVAERKFREAVGVAQLKIALHSYALLHFPMVAGIVLFALGAKKVLEHTGDAMKDMPAVALCGGLALYALAHVAFRLRNTRTLAKARIVTAAGCLAVIPVALEVSGGAALALLALVWLGLTMYETLRWSAFRARVRTEH